MLGTVQGPLIGEPPSHFPDGKTEALSVKCIRQGHTQGKGQMQI